MKETLGVSNFTSKWRRRSCSSSSRNIFRRTSENSSDNGRENSMRNRGLGFHCLLACQDAVGAGLQCQRHVRNPEKAKHLFQLPGADDRLQLLPADLLEPGVFDSIVEGCEGVFHTASPCFGDNATDPQAQILGPAVEGTLNVLRSCAKARTKRIVLTSSTAAVCSPDDPKQDPTSVVDESSWSDPEWLREKKSWYALSKLLAEKAAWEFVKEHHSDMRVINPAGVFGPILQGSVNYSNGFVLGLLNGTMKTFPNMVIGLVGVKDTAFAHVLAYEKDQAEGRYIVSERVFHFADLAALLKKLYPQYHVDAKDGDESNARLPVYVTTCQKLRSLGLDFQPIEEVIHETVASLRENKWLE